jgi:5'-3' exonuclease
MILVDANQLMISNIFSIYGKKINDLEMHHIRYAFLRGITYFHQMFSGEYGKMVLCYDATNYWRRQIFPHYKASRKKQQRESSTDWNNIYEQFDKVRAEVSKELPIMSMHIDTLEADDIIAVLALSECSEEKVLILSSDKDFQQLHYVDEIHQYSPAHKEFIRCENPSEYLVHHMIKGDSSDGIPNIYSDDDAIINDDKKQTIVSQKRLREATEAIEGGKIDDSPLAAAYHRNKTLIDFDSIPADKRRGIIHDFVFAQQDVEGTDFFASLLTYLRKHSLNRILEEMDGRMVNTLPLE